MRHNTQNIIMSSKLEFNKVTYVTRIRRLTKSRGYKLKDLQRHLGISKSWFDTLMSPSSPKCFRMEDHAKICAFLKTSSLYLWYGAGPEYVTKSTMEKMVELANGYADTSKPDLALLMSLLCRMSKADIKLLRTMAFQLADKDEYAAAAFARPELTPSSEF